MNTELFITTPRLGTVEVFGTLSSPSVTITGTGTNFTAADVGKAIIIRTTAGDKRDVIDSYVSATSVTVTTGIDTTQSGCYFYIDYYNADLYDDFPYSLNYAIADIRNPESRNASFSKTIKLPGTKANNLIFDNIFEIDLYGSFNPNIRAFIIIYSNYIPVFNGNLQLLKINRDGDKIEYEVSVFGKIGDLFQKVADKLLTDLDLSDLDEVGTAAEITSTWVTPTDLFYPMIDNGLQVFNVSPQAWVSTQMAPAIRVSRIFEEILSSVGYTCADTATLYSETGMDKLYIPCLKEWRRRVQINASINVTISAYDAGLGLPSGTVEFIGYIQIIRARTGLYENTAFGTITVVSGDSGTNAIFYEGQQELDYGDKVQMVYSMTTAGVTPPTPYGYINSGPATYLKTFSLDNEYSYNSPIDCAAVISGHQFIGNTPNTVIYLNDVTTLGGYDTYGFWDIVNHWGLTPIKHIQGYLPDNYKQRDFLLALIKMFNLYLEPVFDNDTVISFLPRDTYYDNLIVVDWTEKLDVGQNIEIVPMGELDWKEYLFSWKDDADFWNKDYKAKTFETYGQRKVIVENDFIATKKKIDCEIAPMPLIGSPYHFMVLPTCIKDGVNTIPNFFNGVMRMIYFAGLGESTGTSSFTLDGVAKYTYPFSGHLVGTPQVPTFDYNWGSPRSLYYSMADPTLYPYTANLYTSFWENFIQEISDQYSKLVTAYFNLTPEDVRVLDFSAKYFIDGTYFRLNKVIDFNPIGNQLTKCELIKINDAVYGEQVVNNGNTQVGTSSTTFTPYLSSSVLAGGVVVGDANGYGRPIAITQDLTLDTAAQATVTGLRGLEIDATIPTSGQVYAYDSSLSKWIATTISAGSGDVVGPASATDLDIAVFDGVTGKIIKDGAKKISDLQLKSEKDATGGYAGLTLLKINFKNVLNTFTSFFTNSNTAARTYTFQDRDGTIADDTDLGTKQATISLTTTGTSGAATFAANVLNVPIYSTGTAIVLSKSVTDVNVNATAETKVYSYTVAANSLAAGDILDLIARFRKTGTAGTMITRIRFGTNNSTADTLLAQMTSATATLIQNMQRTFLVKDATHIEAFQSASNVNTDDASSGSAVTSVTVNLAVTNYFVVTIQDASAVDTGIFSGWYLRKN